MNFSTILNALGYRCMGCHILHDAFYQIICFLHVLLSRNCSNLVWSFATLRIGDWAQFGKVFFFFSGGLKGGEILCVGLGDHFFRLDSKLVIVAYADWLFVGCFLCLQGHQDLFDAMSVQVQGWLISNFDPQHLSNVLLDGNSERDMRNLAYFRHGSYHISYKLLRKFVINYAESDVSFWPWHLKEDPFRIICAVTVWSVSIWVCLNLVGNAPRLWSYAKLAIKNLDLFDSAADEIVKRGWWWVIQTLDESLRCIVCTLGNLQS